jgi:hypothetical protein
LNSGILKAAGFSAKTNAVRHEELGMTNAKPIRVKSEEQFERLRDSIDLEVSHAADHFFLLKGLESARKTFALEVTNHRLKAVALVTGCKPCSGQRPAKWVPHQAGFKK